MKRATKPEALAIAHCRSHHVGVAEEAAKLVPVVGDVAKYPIAAGKLLGGLLEKVEDSTTATESRKFLDSDSFGVGARHVHDSAADDGALFEYSIVREP